MDACEMCDMGYGAFFKKYSENVTSLIDMCIEHRLILPPIPCPRCHNTCIIDYKRMAYRCNKKVSLNKQRAARCDTTRSLYSGTFFMHRRLRIDTVLLFCNLYLRKSFSYQSAKNEFQLTYTAMTDLAAACREVLVSWCLDNTESVIGGDQKVVEFSKIVHRKGHSEKWVFGGICRETKEVFFEPAPYNNVETLFAVIEMHICPGTKIVSDCWKLLDCRTRDEFQQLQVSHRYDFVDATETNGLYNIKRKWANVRECLPKFGRGKTDFLEGYLARAMFFMRYPNANERFHHFMKAAAKFSQTYE